MADPRPRLRYSEFSTPALPRIVEHVVWYLLYGALITFLVVLVCLLVLEEGAIELARPWRQFDALARYSIGIVTLVAIALIPPAVAATHWADLATRRAIEAQAEDLPGLVATPAQLKRDPEDSRANLRVTLIVYCVGLLVVGAFLLIFGLVSLADDVPGSMQGVVIGAVGVVLGVICGALTLRVRTPFTRTTPRKTWSSDVSLVRQAAGREPVQCLDRGPDAGRRHLAVGGQRRPHHLRRACQHRLGPAAGRDRAAGRVRGLHDHGPPPRPGHQGTDQAGVAGEQRVTQPRLTASELVTLELGGDRPVVRVELDQLGVLFVQLPAHP
ncbi:hypothetical protein ACPCG0_08380 [Propionibacteriaceae bacterium Y1923]|uniref:hypothetical protein n=1 Tax=Aestuariimicrobium sp. Y1814 TaxID=3418742 RepID=UPI003C142939